MSSKRPRNAGILVVVLATLWTGLSATAGVASPMRSGLSLDERVACQRSIEQVFWRHRVWPKENGSSRPSFDRDVPQEVVRLKVEDALRWSNALAGWRHPITESQLQNEIERMAAATKQPEMLRELLAALGNDSFLAAECLARPILAERLIRERYAKDMDPSTVPFDKWWQQARSTFPSRLRAPERSYRIPTVQTGGSQVSAGTPADPSAASADPSVPDSWTPTPGVDGRAGALTVWTGSEMIVWGGAGSSGQRMDGARYDPATDSWRPVSVLGAPGVAFRSLMPHPIWTGTEMIIWGGYNNRDYLNAGARYNPATDTWIPMSIAGAPEGRDSYAAIWTGTEMIVWGGWNSTHVPGMINTGGRYNPETDTWRPTSIAGAPAARLNHTAVWTGTRMIVWGGSGDAPGGIHQAPLAGTDDLNSGGIYDPATDTWSLTGTNLAGAPSDRYYHTAVWTGTEMIVWGGRGQAGYDSLGGRYDPATDIWRPTSTVGAPSLRKWHAALWTGSEMIIWGGSGTGGGTSIGPPVGGGARYNPTTDAWVPVGEINAPPAAYSVSAVWTGEEMIVWGGSGISGSGPFPGEEMAVSFGGRYDPDTDVWTPMNIPAISLRSDGKYGHTAVWTGSEMIVWGGMSGDGSGVPRNSGGIYVPSTDTWRVTTTLDAPQGRASHTAVWTGSEMIVWGGELFPESQNNRQSTNTGARYNPATDSWTVTSIAADTPVKRGRHTAVWSGSEMIVWGGLDGNTPYNSGSRYDPATDVWRRTSATGAPSARASHTAIWTGTKMIVWGGGGSSGGLYDPATDLWAQTNTAGAPSGNSGHTAAWTGTKMIVWGGGTGSGSLYDPAANSWKPTSTVGAPSARSSHTAVWTGTEMVVWGGEAAGAPTNAGGRYDVAGDSWLPTSIPRFLLARRGHSAIWTGSSMVVFGGAALLGPYQSVSATITGAVYRLDSSDTTPPSVTIGSGPSSTTNASIASFSFTASEPASTACSLDGGAFAECTSPHQISDLGEGPHTFAVRATDAATNTGPEAVWNWTIDLTPPDTAITSGPSGVTGSRSASFTFTSTESGATFACSLDGAAFVSCTSPRSYTSLANGSHSFSVAATDPAGNTDTSPAAWTWTVQVNAPPPPEITGPGEGTLQPSSVKIQGTATPRLRVRLYDGTVSIGSVYADAAGGFSSTVLLGEGSHAITATAVDTQGTASDPSAPRRFEVDASGPSVSITTPNFSFLLPGDRIAGTASDNRSVTMIELRYLNLARQVVITQIVPADGSAQVSWSAEPTVQTGVYTVEATAVDAVGNRSAVRSVKLFVFSF